MTDEELGFDLEAEIRKVTSEISEKCGGDIEKCLVAEGDDPYLRELKMIFSEREIQRIEDLKNQLGEGGSE